MSDQLIMHHDSGGVRLLTLNRPEKLNALTGQLVEDLNAAVQAASSDDSVRVVLITGAGRAFCAGRDVSDLGSRGEPSQAEQIDDLTSAGRHVLIFRACAKPIVAAINGVAVGGGLSIALNCDVRLMAEDAKLITGYQKRALSPDGGMSYALPRLIGISRAMDLILSGRDLNAEAARSLGLVAEVFPREGFLDACLAYAANIATGGPIALAYAKRLLLESLDNPVETHLRREMGYLRACLQTEDFREGVQAFAEKRAAVFQGR